MSVQNITLQIIRNLEHRSCICPQPNNKKVLLTSANNSTGETQNQRIVNLIRYSSGGRTQFGNTNANPTTFLGRTEGQPGGTIGPIKNKF